MRRTWHLIGVTAVAVTTITASLGTTAAAATPAAWSVVRTPTPVSQHLHFGSLAAVSCATASACLAVGSGVDNSANQAPLAETWNGTAWTVQRSAQLPGSIAGSFAAVSCSAVTTCTAVGYMFSGAGVGEPLAERWNGTSWTVDAVPSPNGGSLTGVSCASATSCVAVGASSDSSGRTVTLAEGWNGSAWSPLPTPSFAGAPYAVLAAVSCTGPTACTAVGSQTGSGFGAVVERWDGTTWTVQATPTPSDGIQGSLRSVSCSAPAACVAVGDYIDVQFSDAPLAEAWNGSTWVLQNPPRPAGGLLLTLTGVSCASAAACTAVGWTDLGALVYRFAGATWAPQPTPSPSGPPFTTAMLNGVSCATASTCTTAGSFAGTLVERWEGGSWSLQASPNQPGVLISGLTGISCPSSSACIAVGFHDTVAGGRTALVEQWNGSAWSIQRPARLRSGLSSSLTAVSCASPATCTAAGSYVDAAGVHPLAERWDGIAWTVQAVSAPSTGQGLFAGVSCASTMSCVAVGSSVTVSGARSPLAERWDGSTWALQAAPAPANSLQAQLTAVSCSAPSACVAVGDVIDGAVPVGHGHAHEAMAEQWNGSSWTAATIPRPAGAAASRLAAVSCTAPAACTAVGSSRSGAAESTLAERWNGSAWSGEATPIVGSAVLGGVSCTGPSACVAVGWVTTPPTTERAEGWTGRTWTVEATPGPSSPTGRLLDAVSCTGAGWCMAVGSAVGTAGYQVTLAERATQ